jgi:transcriptional regulator with XRE-family HTH domain
MDETAASFGSGLRWWRERRGFSQLDLAGAAETTQRHLSFLESGRAGPSPEMILRLATVLDIPLPQQNALLLATPRVRPGVVASTNGRWPRWSKDGATVNATVDERDADMGGGAVSHDNRVEIEGL